MLLFYLPDDICVPVPCQALNGTVYLTRLSLLELRELEDLTSESELSMVRSRMPVRVMISVSGRTSGSEQGTMGKGIREGAYLRNLVIEV